MDWKDQEFDDDEDDEYEDDDDYYSEEDGDQVMDALLHDNIDQFLDDDVWVDSSEYDD